MHGSAGGRLSFEARATRGHLRMTDRDSSVAEIKKARLGGEARKGEEIREVQTLKGYFGTAAISGS